MICISKVIDTGGLEIALEAANKSEASGAVMPVFMTPIVWVWVALHRISARACQGLPDLGDAMWKPSAKEKAFAEEKAEETSLQQEKIGGAGLVKMSADEDEEIHPEYDATQALADCLYCRRRMPVSPQNDNTMLGAGSPADRA
ncbi:hypothetical protein FQA39_LY19378 [Lamprigera yunnana]|nr:hypothetical protein FQA39_LY19378 [Lamprigera yunnana]